MLGYAVTIFLFSVVAAVVYTSVTELQRVEQELERIDNLRLITTDLEAEIFKAQGSARGLLVMKDEAMMDRFRQSEAEVKRLSALVAGEIQDQKQRENWIKLSEAIQREMEFVAGLVVQIKEDKLEKALELFKTGAGIKLAGEVRKRVEAVHQRQNELADRAKARAEAARDTVFKVLFGGATLAVIFSIATGAWIVRTASRAIGLATNTVSASAKEIAATVTQHERAAVSQAAMVNETNVTVDELNASSRQTSEQVSGVVDVAKRASGLTEEGRTIVGDVVTGMTGLKDKVGSVADQILRLGEQTGQIGNIANVVKDLAGQTNMLALNAAVEAARAGEQGKGFAVVASEVRKLADQSKKSAEEAYGIVSEIQRATNSTIMVTEEGIKTVDEVARIAHKVGELFDSLAEEGNRVYESAQQVGLNARQQSSAVSQIGEAMASINASSRETAAGITQTKTGLQNLEEAAHSLQVIV